MQPVGIRIAAIVFSVAVWGIIIAVGMNFPAIEAPISLLALHR